MQWHRRRPERVRAHRVGCRPGCLAPWTTTTRPAPTTGWRRCTRCRCCAAALSLTGSPSPCWWRAWCTCRWAGGGRAGAREGVQCGCRACLLLGGGGLSAAARTAPGPAAGPPAQTRPPHNAPVAGRAHCSHRARDAGRHRQAAPAAGRGAHRGLHHGSGSIQRPGHRRCGGGGAAAAAAGCGAARLVGGWPRVRCGRRPARRRRRASLCAGSTHACAPAWLRPCAARTGLQQRRARAAAPPLGGCHRPAPPAQGPRRNLRAATPRSMSCSASTASCVIGSAAAGSSAANELIGWRPRRSRRGRRGRLATQAPASGQPGRKERVGTWALGARAGAGGWRWSAGRSVWGGSSVQWLAVPGCGGDGWGRHHTHRAPGPGPPVRSAGRRCNTRCRRPACCKQPQAGSRHTMGGALRAGGPGCGAPLPACLPAWGASVA
jgi:hypothetical protein